MTIRIEGSRFLDERGLTFLRFVVTWEAIEHAGPGRHDEAMVSDGSYQASAEEQTLVYQHGPEQETHTLRIRPRS